MIKMNSSIVIKHDFLVIYKGTSIANGSVEFTNASEQDAAEAAIAAQVAAQYGCDVKDLYVHFSYYTGCYDK